MKDRDPFTGDVDYDIFFKAFGEYERLTEEELQEEHNSLVMKEMQLEGRLGQASREEAASVAVELMRVRSRVEATVAVTKERNQEGVIVSEVLNDVSITEHCGDQLSTVSFLHRRIGLRHFKNMAFAAYFVIREHEDSQITSWRFGRGRLIDLCRITARLFTMWDGERNTDEYDRVRKSLESQQLHRPINRGAPRFYHALNFEKTKLRLRLWRGNFSLPENVDQLDQQFKVAWKKRWKELEQAGWVRRTFTDQEKEVGGRTYRVVRHEPGPAWGNQEDLRL
jgi:hypothetical protein